MNAEEIEVCIEKYGTDIYRFCCFLTGSRTLADDLYQDTFLKALEINKTITVADAKKYLIGITANLWKNQWRKEKRRQKIAPSHVLTEEDLSDSPSEYSAAVAPDLLTSCINRETSAMLRAAIHDLPEKYRVIVLMYYSVDLSTKEIAEQLHLSKGTVTSRLHRSREKIKEKLEVDESLPEYKMTLYHGYKVKTVSDGNNHPLKVSQEGDYITVKNTENLKIQKIRLVSSGCSPAYYSNTQGIFLPGYFAYYPRTGFAQAFLNHPQVLLFDEPTAGLDPKERLRFQNLILDDRQSNRIVLISTHIVSDIEALCDYILVMKSGKIIGVYSPEQLADEAGGKVYQLTENQYEQQKSQCIMITKTQEKIKH